MTYEVLDFWFAGIDDDTPVKNDAHPFNMWFAKDPGLDQKIRDGFQSLYIEAARGMREFWKEDVRGMLAFIVLFDQFSRNMFRDEPAMYAMDSVALQYAASVINNQNDQDLNLIERVFLYMPYMHSEVVADQEKGIILFEKLVQSAQAVGSKNIHYFKSNLQYMNKHALIVRQFGRFPHRNKILNRDSTPEEIEFLKKPGSGF